jgi:hypothetical protein
MGLSEKARNWKGGEENDSRTVVRVSKLSKLKEVEKVFRKERLSKMVGLIVLLALVAGCGPTPTPEVVEKVVKETVVVEKEVEVTKEVEVGHAGTQASNG